jgi:hypothetical protein
MLRAIGRYARSSGRNAANANANGEENHA